MAQIFPQFNESDVTSRTGTVDNSNITYSFIIIEREPCIANFSILGDDRLIYNSIRRSFSEFFSEINKCTK